MDVNIIGYSFIQKDYPVASQIDINIGNIILNIEVRKSDKQIVPEDLTKILNDTQEFLMNKYSNSLR
mgnify:CR=1 FL=1